MVKPKPGFGIRQSIVKPAAIDKVTKTHTDEWKSLNSRQQVKICVKEFGATRAAFSLSFKKWDSGT